MSAARAGKDSSSAILSASGVRGYFMTFSLFCAPEIRPHTAVVRRCMMLRGRVLTECWMRWIRTCACAPRSSGTRYLGMSPRGGIADPHRHITIAPARTVNAAAALALHGHGTLLHKAYIRRTESTLFQGTRHALTFN